MNIFALSHDPGEAARWQHDRHVVKMTLESAQMLCSAVIAAGGTAPYKLAHARHPCTLWAGERFENWFWLYQHAWALNREFKHRFSGRDHASWLAVRQLYPQARRLLPAGPRTPFAVAMPDEYRDPDPVAAYRRYYAATKMANQRWTRRGPPEFAGSGIALPLEGK